MRFPLSVRRERVPSFAEYYTEQVREAADAQQRASFALGCLFAVEPTDRALAGWCDAHTAQALFPSPTEESEAA